MEETNPNQECLQMAVVFEVKFYEDGTSLTTPKVGMPQADEQHQLLAQEEAMKCVIESASSYLEAIKDDVAKAKEELAPWLTN